MAAALGTIRFGNRDSGEPSQAKENVMVLGRKNHILLVSIATSGKNTLYP